MARLSNSVICAEMARRKLQFHAQDDWQSIRLWGLFSWGSVSHLIKSGELITDMKKENRVVWVRPSKEFYKNCIEPMLSKYDLEELTEIAGWHH